MNDRPPLENRVSSFSFFILFLDSRFVAGNPTLFLDVPPARDLAALC